MMMCKLMNSSLGRSRFADKHADWASRGGGRGKLSREGPASPRAAARGCLSPQSEGERPAWEDPNLTAFYGAPGTRVLPSHD